MARYQVHGEDNEGTTNLLETEYFHIAEEFIDFSGTALEYKNDGGKIKIFDTKTNTYIREDTWRST